MSYGTPKWQKWVLPEEEAIEHIKVAYVYAYNPATFCCIEPYGDRYEAGINTFDTANVNFVMVYIRENLMYIF